jgi:hypothetical protein
MAGRTLTRNFAELDLNSIYLKYSRLGVRHKGEEEAEDSDYEGDDEGQTFETLSLTTWCQQYGR